MKLKIGINIVPRGGTSPAENIKSHEMHDMATYEKQLDTLAAQEEGTRIKVVQVAEPDETPTVEFRFQRHGDSLGWVTHRRIRMAAGQIGALKDALNLMDPDGRDAEMADDTPKVESLFEVIPGEGAQRSSG